MLRPRPTIWFELLVARGQYALAMQALAASGACELQTTPVEGSEPVLPRLDSFFAFFRKLEADYAPYWPDLAGHAGLVLDDPVAVLDETLARLEAWARRADPLVAEMRACSARRAELELIARLIAALPPGFPLSQLSGGGSGLIRRAVHFVADPEATLETRPGALQEVFPAEDGQFVVSAADAEEMAEVDAQMAALRATPVPLPEVLAGAADPAATIRARIEDMRRTCLANIERFDALAEETELAGLLNRVAVLDWLQTNSGDVSATRHMMRITGWTDAPDGIRARLDASGVDFVLTLGERAPGDPPMVLDNPGWLAAFEFFPRMLGVPASRDVDPSVLTAVIAPVLFGFMFGDVGQGAVLLAAGLLLSRRWPVLFLLVPGGAMAMVFGVLFGSVFSLEHVIAPLWLHPLSQPIPVLVTALALGVAILALGQAMDFTQAAWHGQALHWLRDVGPVTLAWAGLLGAVFAPALAWLALAGLALALAGAQEDAHWRPAAAGQAAAEFVETLMRLLVSTVSFARVGAFALAHAGLSAAIVGVADALGGAGFWLALLVGNLIILGLEGLVTGIQTTRLILFEFFIRFFRAEGREFRPLSAPRTGAKQGS